MDSFVDAKTVLSAAGRSLQIQAYERGTRMTDTKPPITFSSDALDGDSTILLVSNWSGSEQLSAPYRMEVDLVTAERDLDLKSVLQERCWIEVRHAVRLNGSGRMGIGSRRIYGVPASFECVGRRRCRFRPR